VRNGVIDELLDAETMIMLPFQLPHRTQHQDQFNT